jgi:hypothetical protein
MQTTVRRFIACVLSGWTPGAAGFNCAFTVPAITEDGYDTQNRKKDAMMFIQSCEERE